MSAAMLASAVSTDKPKKLLERVRDVIRRKHFSIRTERAYADRLVPSILRNIDNVSHKSKAGHRVGKWLPAAIG